MVEITRREKTEEELKVIEEARKASGKWMGEEKMEDVAKPEPTDGDDGKLYSGIANRQFTRKFTLSDDIIVKDGELKDGMLRITLERVIPEEKKPRMITIK